jgi:hypothetical protein
MAKRGLIGSHCPDIYSTSEANTHMRRIALRVFLSMILVAGTSALSFSQDPGPKQDMKNAGHEAKDAAKDTGRATKSAAKKTGHAVKRGTKKAAHKTATKTRQGAEKVEDKTSPQ